MNDPSDDRSLHSWKSAALMVRFKFPNCGESLWFESNQAFVRCKCHLRDTSATGKPFKDRHGGNRISIPSRSKRATFLQMATERRFNEEPSVTVWECVEATGPFGNNVPVGQPAHDFEGNTTSSRLHFRDFAPLMFQNTINLWFSNEANATAIYGHIKDWNVSAVTDMSSAFKSLHL